MMSIVNEHMFDALLPEYHSIEFRQTSGLNFFAQLIMTNVNKINAIQKIDMGEFMASHPDLAKNIIPSSVQGKSMAIQLWEQLSRKLNANGPPVKDAKAWRKVYADQKYAVKKKLSFNKASKKRTGGGPYEEKLLTATDELLMEASGLEAAVEGLPVTSFGKFISNDVEEVEYLDESMVDINIGEDDAETPQTSSKKLKKTTKMDLLQENLKVYSDMNKDISSKLEILINVNKSILEVKEAKFNKYIEFKERELKLKEESLQKFDKLLALNERLVRLKEEEEFLNNVP